MMPKTEEEARKCWCPFVNRELVTNGTTAAYCAGSLCMSWRWVTVTHPGNGALKFKGCTLNPTAITEEEAGPRPSDVPENWEFCPGEDDVAGWVEPQESANRRRLGYCGLTGIPQRIQDETLNRIIAASRDLFFDLGQIIRGG